MHSALQVTLEMDNFIREFNRDQLRFKIKYQKDSISADDEKDSIEVNNAKKPDSGSAQMRVFFKEAYAKEFSLDKEKLKMIFDHLKEDLIDLGFLKAHPQEDLKNPLYFYLQFISQLHLESKDYSLKKMNLDEEIRIAPDEPVEALMADYMINNYNQSFVSRSILSLERWEFTCTR